MVIAPSVVVRHQLADRIVRQEHLREAGIVADDWSHPDVLEHVGRVGRPEQWQQFEAHDVVVSHTQSVSPEGQTVIEPPDPGLFDLILFDEAHHLGAPSWVGVRAAFPDAVAIGFTATPYRRDRRALPGRTIFQYPLDKAVDERFFVPIVYRAVSAGASSDSRDRAVATEAIRELHRRNDAAGQTAARLLVRADTVIRADELAALYLELDPSVKLEVITHETTTKQMDEATARLTSGETAGVAFVGVLGEGFDLPSLKIAAYHNPHRSLPVTIQFAGRVARTENPSGDPTAQEEYSEHAVLIATAGDHPEILAELHRDGQRWDKLIPQLAQELDEGVVRAWTVFSPRSADMAEAFTVENFRTFQLADMYKTSTRPDAETLSQTLATLSLRTPWDAVHGIKSFREGDCIAVLLARDRALQWLEATPDGYTDYEHLVLAIHKHQRQDEWWLCVRSTLPDETTARILGAVIGHGIGQPLRSELARYRSEAWSQARITGLGKRAIHPVVAGVMSYETGAGRNVDRALTLDDRALNEAGHAIGVAQLGAGTTDDVQIGIAMNKRRVWQVGYVRLAEYHAWTESICRDLENDLDVGHLGGLRVADSALDPDARPIAAMFDPNFDPNWNAEYSDGVESFRVRDLVLAPLNRPRGDEIKIRLQKGRRTVATVAYSVEGNIVSAPGKILRLGRTEDLIDRLRRLPLSIFFDNGAVLRGPGGCISPLGEASYFPISPRPHKLKPSAAGLSETNRFAIVDSNIAVLPEKDASNPRAILRTVNGVTRTTKPTSLFQYAVHLALKERADFMFCDDGTGEIADFIFGWRALPATGGPYMRLVHCKAMKSAERTNVAAGRVGTRASGLEDAQEVCQQAIRSVAFVLLSTDAMLSRLEQRAKDYPERYVRGTRETFELILRADPTLLMTDIWLLHPGLSRERVMSARGADLRALLSSVRARATDAGTDLALIGRA